MKYQLVLWDFDGTLADTLTLALGIYNRLAAEKKFVPVVDPLAVRQMGMREFLKTHGIPAYRVPMLFSVFLTELKAHASRIALHPGIHDTLMKVSELGIRQGIVSSNNPDTIRACLEANQANQYFGSITGTSRIFGKEVRIRQAFRKLNLTADNVLYVGDEIRDIQAGHAAGLDVAAVTWGLNSAEALAAHRPRFLVSEPAELLPVLSQTASA